MELNLGDFLARVLPTANQNKNTHEKKLSSAYATY